MIKTVIVALVICLIEFLVIVLASPMAKPSLVLRFLPEDVRIAGIKDVQAFFLLKMKKSYLIGAMILKILHQKAI